MKNVGLTFCVLLVGACATAPDRAAEMRADQARVRSYCEGLYRDPVLDPIRTKVAVDLERETTVQMLADNSKASDAEKPVLLIWAKKKQDCWREAMSSMRRFSPPVPPELIALDEATFRRLQLLTANLYNQALTYGEFARKRSELNAERNAKREELRQAAAQQSNRERAEAQRQWEAEQAREKQRLHELEVACIRAGGAWKSEWNSCWAGSREIQIRVVK